MGKVTNKDIAERAGVSAAAVSLAIHGRKGISEATRANILRIVQEMNYAPPSRSCTDSRAVVLIPAPGCGCRPPPCCRASRTLPRSSARSCTSSRCSSSWRIFPPSSPAACCSSPSTSSTAASSI